MTLRRRDLTRHEPTRRISPIGLAWLCFAAYTFVALLTSSTTLIARTAVAVDRPATTLTPKPHAASASPMTRYLCATKTISCSVRVATSLREGAAGHVFVTGRPSTNVNVRLFRLDLIGTRIHGIKAFGRTVAVHLNERGMGTTLLPMAPFANGESGGWALVSLADTTWHGDPSVIVGEVVSLQGRSPTLLGDGYGTDKPVGATLDMELTNFIGDTRFAAEYLGDGGDWHNVTVGLDKRDDPSGQPVLVLRYVVPNGLLAKPYRFRAHNVTDPSAADPEWAVTPSPNALPQARAEILQPPVLGSAVTTGPTLPGGQSATVITAASILGVISILIVLAGPAVLIRRRRIVTVTS